MGDTVLPFPPVTDGKFAQAPSAAYQGKHVIVERLHSKHATSLWQNIQLDHYLFQYLRQRPSHSLQEYQEYIDELSKSEEHYRHVIVLIANPQDAVGLINLQRHDKPNRVVEIGNVIFSKKLQGSRAGTEAYYLLMKASFEEMNSRRLEWRCDPLHESSMKAAIRLGFALEAVFRNVLIIKGCSRDLAWFSIIDSEWPSKRGILETWLNDCNFDEEGRQKKRLAEITLDQSIE